MHVADTLNSGEKLEVGGSLTSNNGAYTLVLQGDGNLVLVAGGEPVWASGTAGKGAQRAELQGDGNFVLYAGDSAVWASDTAGNSGARLVVQDDRNLVLYGSDGAKWSSDTRTDEVPAAAPVEVAPAAVEEPIAEEVPPPPPAPRTYTVQSGDTLWAIAEQFYGDGNRYPEIAAASGIDNPDLINPGQVLTIP